ncbi:MAG: flavin reductase family protein [Opitutales bacterium]|nr:flavin reductase family protein [Opitutales bacterium]
MTFDLMDTHAASAYKILSCLVTPRPIAWVTTVNADGIVNAAPFSFFNVFGSKPPLLAFAPGDREPGVPKDTARNIRQQRAFVVNLVDEGVLQAMNASARPLPYGVSEIEGSGLNLIPGEAVDVPRIAEAPASLECTEHSTIEIGGNRLVIGIVHRVHARDGLFDSENLAFNAPAYNPIGRMASPSWYCHTTDLFEIKRPQ